MLNIYRSTKKGQFFFNVTSWNNHIMGSSETYHNKADAISAAKALITIFKRNMVERCFWYHESLKTGQLWFTFDALNGNILITSELYTRYSSIIRAKNRLKALFADPAFCQIIDHTEL